MDITNAPPTPNPEQAAALGQGIEQFLKPIVLECDEQVKSVLASQAELSEQIDKLTERTIAPNVLPVIISPYLLCCHFDLVTELDKFVEESKVPPLTPYVQKLANARARIQSVNQMLDRIMQRLSRISTSISSSE